MYLTADVHEKMASAYLTKEVPDEGGDDDYLYVKYLIPKLKLVLRVGPPFFKIEAEVTPENFNQQ